MNAVWNSYGQLCGCPEIFKKSCKFFCRELDIRVTEIMEPHIPKIPRKTNLQNFSYHIVPIIQTILFRYH